MNQAIADLIGEPEQALRQRYQGRLLRVINQMDLTPCDGCDGCGLRCAAGVPMTRVEYDAAVEYMATEANVEELSRILAQDKAVDLGDGVSVAMCRFRDMERGWCAIYPARPLICRLFGHVQWLPCPIDKVPRPVPTEDAIALMQEYAKQERHTFEEWENDTAPAFNDPAAAHTAEPLPQGPPPDASAPPPI